MANKWLSMAGAAATLNISTKTLSRRLKAGRFESRRSEDGRVEVLVDVPDTGPHLTDALAQQGERQLQLAGGAITAWQDLAETTRRDLRQARRTGAVGWTVAAALVLATCGLTWYGTREHGRAELAEQGRQQAEEAAREARLAVLELSGALDSARDETRQEAVRGRETADRAMQAVARAHDLELQLSQLEAAIERDRLASARGGALTSETGPAD